MEVSNTKPASTEKILQNSRDNKLTVAVEQAQKWKLVASKQGRDNKSQRKTAKILETHGRQQDQKCTWTSESDGHWAVWPVPIRRSANFENILQTRRGEAEASVVIASEDMLAHWTSAKTNTANLNVIRQVVLVAMYQFQNFHGLKVCHKLLV